MARGGAPDEAILTPQYPAEDLQRKIVPRAEPIDFGRPLEEASDILDRKMQADSAAWAGNQMSDFRLQAVQSLTDAKTKAEPGAQNFTSTFLAQYDQNAQKLLQTAGGNTYAEPMLRKGIGEFRDTLGQESLAFETKQALAYREDAIDQGLNKQLALVESNPGLATQVGSTLMDQVRSLPGDPATRLMMGRKIDEQLTLAAANGLTRQDPRSVIQALRDPTSAPQNLEPITRLNDQQREAVLAKANEHLSDAVYSSLSAGDIRGANRALNQNRDLMDARTQENLQRAINGQVEHNMVMHDKMLTDTSNDLLKKAMQMSLHPDGKDGPLTPQWIEKHYAGFKPEAYEYANKLLAGKEITDDPATTLDLYRRTLAGQDTTDDVMRAAGQRQIKTETAEALLQKNESIGSNPVKQQSIYIEKALEPAPFAQKFSDYKHDQADALEQFHAYLRLNPQAKASEIREESYNLVRLYKDKSGNALSGELPLYFMGSRMAPDVGATWAATRQAHDLGQISDADFARQASLIAGVQAAMDFKAKTPSPAPKPQASP
jgi:hypothetical protein